jgi:hypothetical protein
LNPESGINILDPEHWFFVFLHVVLLHIEDTVVCAGGSEMSAAARTASLDKMVTLIAVLVEKSRGEDNCIHLSQVSLLHTSVMEPDPYFLDLPICH